MSQHPYQIILNLQKKKNNDDIILFILNYHNIIDLLDYSIIDCILNHYDHNLTPSLNPHYYVY